MDRKNLLSKDMMPKPITSEAPSHKNCLPLRLDKSKKAAFTGLKSAA